MKAIILISIGTPSNTSSEAVADYLRGYLGDPNVISAPSFIRKRIIERHVITDHLPSAVERYKALASLYGGELPLRLYGERLRTQTERLATDDNRIYLATMPSDADALSALRQQLLADGPFESITLVSLFPQHTYSSSIATLSGVKRFVREIYPQTPIRTVHTYGNNDRYIEAVATLINTELAKDSYDLIAVSYHSIPLVHQIFGCLNGFNYRKQCSETMRLITERLPKDHPPVKLYFQSAMGRKWLRPMLKEAPKDWLRNGYKKVLVACPGFLIDCLENVYDVSCTLSSEFTTLGGEKCMLVPSLNDSESLASLMLYLAQQG